MTGDNIVNNASKALAVAKEMKVIKKTEMILAENSFESLSFSRLYPSLMYHSVREKNCHQQANYLQNLLYCIK